MINRPDALNIHSALCARPGVLHYCADNSPSQPGSKHAVDGIYEFMSVNHINAYFPNIEISTLPTLACRPVAALLALFGISHVNLWVLDVEGAELAVLESTDFAAITIDVIMVELDGGNKDKDNRVRELLTTRGYVRHSVIVINEYFVHRTFKPSVSDPPPAVIASL